MIRKKERKRKMYFSLQEGCLHVATQQEFYEKENMICILSKEEWQKDETLRRTFQMQLEQAEYRCSRMEQYGEYWYAMFHIPPKEGGRNGVRFAFYYMPGRLLFIDCEDCVAEYLLTLVKREQRVGERMGELIYTFLGHFSQEDLSYLQALEREMAVVEEQILENHNEDFHMRMFYIKKKILEMQHAYRQMAEVMRQFTEAKEPWITKEESRMFAGLNSRLERLAQETQLLREYVMQVQEVYQSQIGIRQNDIMKILTIVTTVLLPLTLITGWYGMNFQYMPELQSRYGYPAVMAGSIGVVAGSLFLLKKKGYW